jgi:RNA polymerase subunit RPABC4/transcription elongation factor Spt4
MRRSLLVFGSIYAAMLLLTFLVLWLLGSHELNQYQKHLEDAWQQEARMVEEQIKNLNKFREEKIVEIKTSQQRQVDEEALEIARNALDELAAGIEVRLQQLIDEGTAIGDRTAAMESKEEARAYLEGILSASSDIEGIFVCRLTHVTAHADEYTVSLHVAREPFESLEGKKVSDSPFQHQFSTQLFQSGYRRLVLRYGNEFAWFQYGMGRAAFEEDPKSVEALIVGLSRDEKLEEILRTKAPVGHGFGLWERGGDHEYPISGLAEGRAKDAHDLIFTYGDTVWNLSSGGRTLFYLKVGPLPDGTEDAAVLVKQVYWEDRYGFAALLGLFMEVDEIYNLAWQQGETAEVEARFQREKENAFRVRTEREKATPSVAEQKSAFRKQYRLVKLQILLAVAVVLFLWLFIPAFVYADASRMGLPAGLWAFLVLLSSVVGLVVYLLVRPRNRVVCHACGGAIEKDFVVCPTCGAELKASCPSCGKTVSPDWKMCPYCRAELRVDVAGS